VFAAHSKYSIAFVGSNYAQLSVARTADETVTVDVGKWTKFASHTNVRVLFATMVERNNARHSDAISQLFSLKAIGSGAARGFRHDGLGNGYEATLVGTESDGVWYPATLTWKNSRGKTTVLEA
jgi:hypothetical protein